MKYIIDIPEQIAEVSVDYMKKVGMSIEPYTESDRKAIEDEVWELVRKIECLTVGETEDCFDVEYDGIPFVANMFSYQETKSKYEAWKKQKEVINVGDEVEYEGCGEIVRFVVTGIKDSTAYGFRQLHEYDDVSDVGEYCDIDMLKKTGRHFDEVEELLKKMKE